MDAALTISDYKKKNSTWVPGVIPKVIAGMGFGSVQARNDHAVSNASSAWKEGYRRCFSSTLTTFGLEVDESGKVSAP